MTVSSSSPERNYQVGFLACDRDTFASFTNASLSAKRLLLIIPAYNEAGAIEQVIKNSRQQIPEADVLVVDDGSADQTARLAREAGAIVVSLPFNCGIGTAMQTGYLYALQHDYDIAIQVDGDGQHDPAQIYSLVLPIIEGRADLVIGSRFIESDSFHSDEAFRSTAVRRVGIAWLARLISLIVHQRITDPTSGFRAANKPAIASFAREYPLDYPEPEVIVSLHRSGLRIAEVPAKMMSRQSGQSSITAIRSVYYMIKVTLAILVTLIRERPKR